MVNHPLPKGTRVRTLYGEMDCDGVAHPGSVGIMEYLGKQGRQGHCYIVTFPLDERGENYPEKDFPDVVQVMLDQEDSIDDQGLYEIMPPGKADCHPEQIALWLGRAGRLYCSEECFDKEHVFCPECGKAIEAGKTTCTSGLHNEVT